MDFIDCGMTKKTWWSDRSHMKTGWSDRSHMKTGWPDRSHRNARRNRSTVWRMLRLRLRLRRKQQQQTVHHLSAASVYQNWARSTWRRCLVSTVSTQNASSRPSSCHHSALCASTTQIETTTTTLNSNPNLNLAFDKPSCHPWEASCYCLAHQSWHLLHTKHFTYLYLL